MANEMAAGSRPNAAMPTEKVMMPTDSQALRWFGMRNSRSASGTQPLSAANSVMASGGPCISNRSPGLIGNRRKRTRRRWP